MSKKLTEELRDFSGVCRIAATERMNYISNTHWTIGEVENWDPFIFDSQMSSITLAGKNLRIQFRVHFRKSSLQRLGIGDGSETRVVDFFNEFSNLWAGAVKQVLFRQQLVSGISLPISLPGFDELIFSDKQRPDRLLDCFEMVANNVKVFVTIGVDAMSQDVFNGLGRCGQSLESNEIEFF